MAPDSTLVYGALLFLAAAAGYGLARLRPEPGERERGGPGEDYLRGLGYLVDDQPDKAIEVFVSLLEVDSDTLETHFALGKLFRRRGETERAIRIHQNIMARPGLDRVHRERALFELSEDYLKAGLFDRAEKLLEQLVASAEFRDRALRHLVDIYERQRDWEKAIECRERLQARGLPEDRRATAHYQCELAEICLERGDEAGARQRLRKARGSDPGCVRTAILRADIAARSGDLRLVRRLLRDVIEERAEFAVVALSKLAETHDSAEEREESVRLIDRIIRRSPELVNTVAHAAILDRRLDDPVSLGCLRKYVSSDRLLGAILAAMESGPGQESVEPDPETLRRIRLALRRLALDGPRFGCVECGFTSRTLVWKCPSCQSWESLLPAANLKFVSHLGSKGFVH